MSSEVHVDVDEREKLFDLLSNGKGKRQEISLAVMNPEVRLGDLNPASGNSLLHELLTKVTNGDKIVLQKLDACIGTTNDDPDSEDFNVLIDQKCLVGVDPTSLSMLSDLLSLPRDATVSILNHPVITTFVKRKWPALLFGIMSLIYVFFVINFSVFLLLMFSSTLSGFDCTKIDKDELTNATCKEDCARTCYRKAAFYDSAKHGDYLMLVAECSFVFNAIVLLLQEIWQFLALGKDYAREAENWFEIIIIILSMVAFFIDDGSLQSIIGSVAVCCAWIELVLMCGRIPIEGGTFNIMFYASSKRVLQIAIGLLLMVIAFAAAFYVLHYDLGGESPFNEIPKSIVTSFSWMLDGADVEAIWDSSTKAHRNPGWVEVIAVCLLVFMMIFGSLILINLIVATIIMDFGWIRELALETSLRNQAHSVVQARAGRKVLERFFKIIFAQKVLCEKEKDERFRELEVMVCVHSVCNCGKETLDEETTKKLKKILNIEEDQV